MATGYCWKTVIQVLPPLIIQEEEVRQVLAILDRMIYGLEAAFC
jgi:4-aminobutyrate aminotransferase-like enzyme